MPPCLSTARKGDGGIPSELPGCGKARRWRRRRLRRILAALVASKRKRRGGWTKREYAPGDFDEMRGFFNSPAEFSSVYRLHPDLFDALLDEIGGELQRNPSRQRAARGVGPDAALITPAMMLAMTLRWLAGESPHPSMTCTACFIACAGRWYVAGHHTAFWCGQQAGMSTFYGIAWHVIDVIIAKYADDMLAFAELGDSAALAGIAAGFDRLTIGVVDGCVGMCPAPDYKPNPNPNPNPNPKVEVESSVKDFSKTSTAHKGGASSEQQDKLCEKVKEANLSHPSSSTYRCS